MVIPRVDHVDVNRFLVAEPMLSRLLFCNYDKVDLSKLKRHRGAKDAAALEELVSSYRKQMLELQGQINQMTPNMRVSELDMVQKLKLFS